MAWYDVASASWWGGAGVVWSGCRSSGRGYSRIQVEVEVHPVPFAADRRFYSAKSSAAAIDSR